jgi:hypothetical protein
LNRGTRNYDKEGKGKQAEGKLNDEVKRQQI